MQILPGRLPGLTDVAFSGDGRFVAACGKGGLVTWDLTRPQAAPIHLASRPTSSLRTIPNGGFLAEPPEGLHAYDPATSGTGHSLGLRGGLYRSLLDPQVSADGTQVVAPGRSGRIRFYDLVDGKAVLRWAFPNKSRDYPGVDFLPPGDRLLVLERGSNYMRRARGWRQWLVLRSTADGKKVGEWDIGTRSTLPDHFLISPDGSTLVMVHGHELELWDTGDLERPLRRVRPASRSQILRAAFHPSGDVLMTVGNQPAVRFWDARTWAEARTFAWDLGKLQSVAFSPDGSMAAVGAVTGRVLVWDVDL